MKKSWRVFCAIQLPSDLLTRVTDYSTQLRKAMPEARASWGRDESLHLTLKFIGEIDTPRVEKLSDASARAVMGVEPFELVLGGTGVFPPRGMPRVLWLGVKDPSGNLARLQQQLETECALEGIEREERAYHPHLTIARLRPDDKTRALASLHCETEFKDVTTTVSELVVMRSELGPGGSRYSVVSKHTLGEGA